MEMEASEERKRPQFGNRLLRDEKEIFKHNAWDDVSWTDEQLADAEKKIEANSEVRFSSQELNEFESSAASFWNSFYETHQTRFFKDRHWLFTEFPELCVTEGTPEESGTQPKRTSSEEFPGASYQARILEVGCGAGNSIFPILESARGLFVYGCDFSEVALKLVESHPDFNPDRCRVFQSDVSSDELNFPFPEKSLDAILLVFVLSAIHPDKMQRTILNLTEYLKPGGKILFRDYGRYDMAQLRFKPGRCLGQNFYARGDGTRVYFFTHDEVDDLFVRAGLQKSSNHIDRRLQVNRGKQLTMYRVWIQAVYFRVPDDGPVGIPDNGPVGIPDDGPVRVPDDRPVDVVKLL
ncbi:unnamed protein product [Cyprideis torosa]|uniref:tRNA N(3)-methylcytidine methyltransferase n=1 Tax=Cyprideis torosa TaxID=163714 RepID=A0A7R8WQJ8_9CRUS|nr:unnamed protein product [Cyprideis torosa]CAG0901831.1 unnamed protein product [Cyprideis torosa]